MTFKDFMQGTVELKLIYNPGLSLYSGMAVTPHIKTSKILHFYSINHTFR